MVESSDNRKNILKAIEDLNEKMLKFSTILEKFGLDIITKLGQTNLVLRELTDRINDVHKATIDIKALSPQLSKILEGYSYMESELDLIKSLVQKMSVSMPISEEEQIAIDRDISATKKKKNILKQLLNLRNEIKNYTEANKIKEKLLKIKQDIFEFTGGSKVSYEISKFVNSLETSSNLTKLKDEIADKITFWINKI